MRTKEERDELVLSNMRLVHLVLNRDIHRHKDDPEYEDLAQIGMLALVNAANYWDGESSSFAHYAINAIRNNIYQSLYTSSGRRRDNITKVSLNTPINEKEDSILEDVIPGDDGVDYFDDVNFKNILSPKELELYEFIKSGGTCSEFAKEDGSSKQNAFFIIKKIRTKWIRHFGKVEGYNELGEMIE